jgi:methylenetetrahydrofolate dehydrogenase (NADP+) / methenyltetrahydrofolate cyclohydrolase
MTDAVLIDGKAFAAQLRETIGRRAAILKEQHGLVPGLAAVLVGEDPASQVYVRNKEKQTIEAGMASVGRRLPADISEADLMAVVAELNADPAVHGILVQLPLPDHIAEKPVIEMIDVAKDVDGFHPLNVGALSSGEEGLVPCTPRGCMMLLDDVLGDLTGMNAVVVGRSNIVGKPIAQLLLAANCTVTIAHSRTKDLPGLCRTADILIAAVGRPQMIKGDWVKPGAAVIDVGINRIEAEGGKTRLVGDVDFAEAVQVAGSITPVPGGVGPMTIACLLENTLIACCRQNGVEAPEA